MNIQLVVGEPAEIPSGDYFGALLQYPNTFGAINDWSEWIEAMHQQGVLVAVATDLLSLTLLKPPGEMGADIVFGSAQRFGVPMGYGGPHAAFLATRDTLKRSLPGRLIGVSQDRQGQIALSHGPADPGTAYPARQGHQQYLHRPGAARRDRKFLCSLSWS